MQLDNKLIYVFGLAHVKIGVRIKAGPQPLFRLSQAWRTAKPIRIMSVVSNWFRRRTSHELNSLNSIRLIWSTGSEPGLKENPWIDLFVVIMASGIARGRVRTTAATTTVESRKMAAILQIIGRQRHAALVYLDFFSYMTSCYDQLTPVKSSSLLTSTMWPYKLTADQVLVFDWIAGSCQVKLLKTELGWTGNWTEWSSIRIGNRTTSSTIRD